MKIIIIVKSNIPFIILETPEELFRERTLSNHILTDYFMSLGKSYTKNTMLSAMKKICALKKPIILDPTKPFSDESKSKLSEIIRECVKSITQSANDFPEELRQYIEFMNQEAYKQFDEKASEVITRFLYSRLYIASILDPVSWGLLKEINEDISRTLISVSKILNYIVSGQLFDEKSHLSNFNNTIKKYHVKFNELTKLILSKEGGVDENEILNREPLYSEQVYMTSFQVIHFCLYLYKDAIANYRNTMPRVTAHEAKVFFDLFGILEESELAEGKPELGDISLLGYKNTSFLKSFSKANIRPKPPTSSSNKDEKSTKIPFVRQQSEKWNREHQKMLLSQNDTQSIRNKTTTKDQTETVIPKLIFDNNDSNILISKDENLKIMIKGDVINISEIPLDTDEKASDLSLEESFEKSISPMPSPKSSKKKKKSFHDIDLGSLKVKFSKVSISNDELVIKTPKGFDRDRSSSFSVKSKNDRYMDFINDTDPKNLNNLIYLIRELSNENNKLKQEKEIFLKEISLLKEELDECKEQHNRKMNELYSYNSNLIKTIMYRGEQNDNAKQLGLKLKRTFHPSLDDDMFDFASTSPQIRRKIIFEAINYVPVSPISKEGKISTQPIRNESIDNLEKYAMEILGDVSEHDIDESTGYESTTISEYEDNEKVSNKTKKGEKRTKAKKQSKSPKKLKRQQSNQIIRKKEEVNKNSLSISEQLDIEKINPVSPSKVE